MRRVLAHARERIGIHRHDRPVIEDEAAIGELPHAVAPFIAIQIAPQRDELPRIGREGAVPGLDVVLALGAVAAEITDEHAIVERETAFVGWGLSPAEFDAHVARHVEWALPTARPVLAQGLAAGMPVKLWFEHDRVLLLVSSGLVHEAVDRFGVPALVEGGRS